MPGATKNEVIVLSVVEGGRSVAEAARRFAVSRRWVHVLLARYGAHGIEAVAPRSRTPVHSPHATPAKSSPNTPSSPDATTTPKSNRAPPEGRAKLRRMSRHTCERCPDTSQWWARWGLNPRPTDYESAALTG